MDDLLKLIKTTKFEFPILISSECMDLISKMLVMDPRDRITIPEILNHPWLSPPDEEGSEKSDSKKS